MGNPPRSSSSSPSEPLRPRDGQVAVEHRPERLRTGGSRRPLALAVAIGCLLAALVWQPWGRTTASPGPGPVAQRSPAPTAPARPPAPSPAASSSRSVPSAAPGVPVAYVSLVDNEWTVVGLLSSSVGGSTDEPATQHPAPAGASDALLVLQQGVVVSRQPIEQAGQPDLACHGSEVPRDQRAVFLPAGRVVYLGVTFPDISPAARVSVVDLDAPGARLGHVPSVVVPLSGRADGQAFRLPGSGPGAVQLFALAPAASLPSATYRFDVTLPGTTNHRFVYACVGP